MNADNMNPFLVVALLATLFTEAGRGDELAALAEKIRARTMRGGSEYWNCSRLEESRVSRNKFDGALVLQHTGMRYCEAELVSLSAENFLLAHFLFK